MRNYTLIFLLILSGLTNAQGPVIDGMYLPVWGTRIEQVYDTTAAQLDVPSKGENQVWDYSEKFVNILDTYNLATSYPEESPYYDWFPEATHASFLTAPYGFGDSLWLHFVVDTNGITNIGMYGKNGWGPDTVIYCEPTEIMMPFLVQYGDSTTDSSMYRTFIEFNGNDAMYKFYQYKTFVGEGYGSLTTPVGTFDDVLLGTEKINSIDSVWFDIDGDGTYDGAAQLGNSWSIRYNFLRNNTFGSTHLMQLKTDELEQEIDYGWYTLPVDFGSIQGRVFDDVGEPVTDGEAYLFREHSNFSKDDVLATAPLDNNGYYEFDSIPYGEYRVSSRANLTMYNRSYTTYYGDTTEWIAAPTFTTSGDTAGIEINLKYYDEQQGNGVASGNLLFDWGVGGREGDPVPGIDIIVQEDPGGNSIVQTRTDGAGFYQLGYLEPGNYTLWVDVPGLQMAGSYNFTVNEDDTYYDLDFTLGIDSIYPNYVLGVEATSNEENNLTLYPNPSIGSSRLLIQNQLPGNVSYEILDVFGRRVESVDLGYRSESIIHEEIDLSEKNVKSGIYMINVRIDNTIYTIRFVKM